jgi:hypothetical protein
MTETKEESCQTKYNRKKPVISGRVDPTTKQAFVRAAQKRNIKPNKLHSDIVMNWLIEHGELNPDGTLVI